MSWWQSEIKHELFNGEVLLHERILIACGYDVLRDLIHHLSEFFAGKTFFDRSEQGLTRS